MALETWTPESAPPKVKIGPTGWSLALIRAVLLATLVFGGLMLMLLLRVIERPFFGMRRPWTPWITQTVCRAAFMIMGIRHRIEGARMREPGAVVSNHVSWMDIFALNARKRIYFVSKAEVAKWPGIGWLAKATGTVFIERDPRQAQAQKDLFERRLLAGHKLVFFPEGTSTDGRRVLPFKTTLFQAFLTPELRQKLYVQPVTLIYRAPEGAHPRFYGWWGDMEFGPHLWRVLASRRQGSVTVRYHLPLKVDGFANRKALAAACEAAVREGLPADLNDG